MSPFFTTSIAGAARDSILTNHCFDAIGSMHRTAAIAMSDVMCSGASVLISKSPCEFKVSSESICFAGIISDLAQLYLPPFSFILCLFRRDYLYQFRDCGVSPTSKSFGSCQGVIFTQPVPKSMATYSSAMTGISRFNKTGVSKFCL
jgi:hypothetical protein